MFGIGIGFPEYFKLELELVDCIWTAAGEHNEFLDA